MFLHERSIVWTGWTCNDIKGSEVITCSSFPYWFVLNYPAVNIISHRDVKSHDLQLQPIIFSIATALLISNLTEHHFDDEVCVCAHLRLCGLMVVSVWEWFFVCVSVSVLRCSGEQPLWNSNRQNKNISYVEKREEKMNSCWNNTDRGRRRMLTALIKIPPISSVLIGWFMIPWDWLTIKWCWWY